MGANLLCPTQPRQQLIVLMGPTASGKTRHALTLAQHFPVEIISVDSALVYRGMDIGTAKPSLQERRACPHHLIDIINPMESYSAAQFYADAKRLVTDIQSRGRIPLLVGGTMLYFKVLREGLSLLPQADPSLRAQLDDQAAKAGWPAMHAQLATLDPEAAARLNPADSQRIQRALEVCLLTGKPMSQLLVPSGHAITDTHNTLHLALVPAERQWLHHRIRLRFQSILEQGLLNELSELRQRYPALSLDRPSMRCVGYRQAWEYQQGLATQGQLIDKGIAATRQLAKRQLTWIRSMANVVPVNAQCSAVSDQLLQAVNAWLTRQPLPPSLRFIGDF